MSSVKIVVRGERETGKTTITKLLSGGLFESKYTQSKPGEVETVTVQWGAGREYQLNHCCLIAPLTITAA